MHNRFAFTGAEVGVWRVTGMTAPLGAGLPGVSGVSVAAAPSMPTGAPPDGMTASGTSWVLHGLTSNIRYATRIEVTALRSSQEPLGRAAARYAALIPIKKSAAWWDLAQDERRAIFEETSHHTAIGLAYLPAIARQLYHCRDLGEPFDFLTWFEFAPEHAGAFDDLVARLRESREWTFVEREVDIRLER